MNLPVVLYSCVTDDVDDLDESLFKSDHRQLEGVECHLFSSGVYSDTRRIYNGVTWHLHPVQSVLGLTGRRLARFYKINSHLVFPYRTTIWIDGSQRVVGPVANLVQYANHVGTFKHPDRKCVYEEMLACNRLRKDSLAVMDEQLSKYRNLWKYPKNAGLAETACVVRCGTEEVQRFNEEWWVGKI